ncbi:MAG: hypothetical protein WCJ30_13930 [Deltaproteobacteria bacterium]
MNVAVAQPELRDELLPLAREITRRARSASVSPRRRETRADTPIDGHHLYWSHLGLALGVERFVRCSALAAGVQCPDDGDGDRLLTRVVTTLRDRLRASPVAQIPSYPGSAIWPADNTVTLLALRLYDATHDTHLADATTRAFLAAMQGRRDRSTGLYHSCVSPLWYHAIPRGCALSWTTLYLAQVAPEAAYEQYRGEREFFSRDILGMGGFREWPEGRGGSMDADSGPIILGVGMAATGLGLGAARLFHDDDRYTTIRRTTLVFGLPAWLPSHGHLLAPLLGEAMLFNGRTARPWFVSLRSVSGRAPPPWFPAVLSLGDLALLVVVARRIRARLRDRAPARPVERRAGDAKAPREGGIHGERERAKRERWFGRGGG